MSTSLVVRTTTRSFALAAVAHCLVLTGLVSLSIKEAHAQTYTDTFSGTGADSNFTTTSNFSQSGGAYSSGGSGAVAEFTRTGFTDLTDVTVSMVIQNSEDSGILFATDGSTSPLQNGLLADARTYDGTLLIQQIYNGSFLTPYVISDSMATTVGQTLYLTLTDDNDVYTASVYNYSSSTVGSLIDSVTYDANTNPDNISGLRTSGDTGIFQQDNTSSFENFTVTNDGAAPEPSALLLLAPGALGLIAARRRAIRAAR